MGRSLKVKVWEVWVWLGGGEKEVILDGGGNSVNLFVRVYFVC